MSIWLLRALFFLALEILMIGGVFALDIETLVMPGEVIAGHAKYETDCAACHQAGLQRGRVVDGDHHPLGVFHWRGDLSAVLHATRALWR